MTLYGFGDAAPWFYLALEYIPGGTLRQRLDGPLPPRVAARLLETIARAVAGIHRAGLLHLDLKPSNILLDGDDEAPWDEVIPKVSDFGIARLSGELIGASGTSFGSGLPIGTPSYMAPEQAGPTGTRIGTGADIHALGAILFELLTGRPPIQGNSIVATLEQIWRHEPVSPRRLNPAVPRDLETICLKCLQKDPRRRYESAEALADDLLRYQERRTIEGRPVSFIERAWRTYRRRPLVATLAAALLFSLSAGFLGMILLWRHSESARRRAEQERGHAEQASRRYEMERNRAEAESRLTMKVLAEMIEHSVEESHFREVSDSDRFITRLEHAREYLLELGSRRPGDPVIAQHLILLASRLGTTLGRSGRFHEARAAYEESLRTLDTIDRQDTHEYPTLADRILIQRSLASAYLEQDDARAALLLMRKTIAIGEELVRLRPDARSICQLAMVRNDLVSLSCRQGELDQARSLLVENRSMLADVSGDIESPQIAVCRIITGYELDRLNARAGPATAFAWRDDGGGRVDPVVMLASPEADRLPARSWAELALGGLRAPSHSGIGPSEEAEAGYALITYLFKMAAAQRHDGKREDARRTADRMLSLGRLLVERRPSQPASHIAISEAYMQLSKNAWRFDDQAAVERNLKLAVDATQHALALDPGDEHARFLFEQRQQRLNALQAPRNPNQTVGSATRAGS